MQISNFCTCNGNEIRNYKWKRFNVLFIGFRSGDYTNCFPWLSFRNQEDVIQVGNDWNISWVAISELVLDQNSLGTGATAALFAVLLILMSEVGRWRNDFGIISVWWISLILCKPFAKYCNSCTVGRAINFFKLGFWTRFQVEFSLQLRTFASIYNVSTLKTFRRNLCLKAFLNRPSKAWLGNEVFANSLRKGSSPGLSS